MNKINERFFVLVYPTGQIDQPRWSFGIVDKGTEKERVDVCNYSSMAVFLPSMKYAHKPNVLRCYQLADARLLWDFLVKEGYRVR